MRAFTLNALGLGLVLLSACGSHSNEDARGQASENKAIVGPLTTALKEIQTSEYASACDRKLDATKTKLVNFVFQRGDLEYSRGTTTQTNSAEWIKFSGNYLHLVPKGTPSPDEWTELRYGWGRVDKVYEANKNNLTPALWNYVNSAVRSILGEDKDRVIYGVNYSIDHANVEKLADIKKVVDLCLSDSACTNPIFPADLEATVKSIPYYNYYYSNLKYPADVSQNRSLIARFQKRINADSLEHLPHWNTELKFEKEGAKIHFKLPLDASKFSSTDQALVKTTIESVWKTDAIDLQVAIQSPSENPNLYELLFHTADPGGRDFVSWSEKTMNLYPLSPIRSIAHEFGHVIGFTDHYYTVWDSDQCEYDQQTSDSDLMSNSNSGEVTPAEWDALKTQLQIPAT